MSKCTGTCDRIMTALPTEPWSPLMTQALWGPWRKKVSVTSPTKTIKTDFQTRLCCVTLIQRPYNKIQILNQQKDEPLPKYGICSCSICACMYVFFRCVQKQFYRKQCVTMKGWAKSCSKSIIQSVLDQPSQSTQQHSSCVHLAWKLGSTVMHTYDFKCEL